MSDDHNQQLRQLQSAIERLRAAIDSLADMPEAQGPLQAQLAEKEQQLAALRIQTGGVDMGTGTTIGQMGDLVGRDKIETQTIIVGAQPTEQPTMLLQTYLAGVIGAASHLTLTEVDNADLEQGEVLLEDVYTRLEVASAHAHELPSGDEDEKRSGGDGSQERLAGDGRQQLTAIAALAQRGRMVLLGAPGSGKSTLTRFLALCLARAGQGEARWLAHLGDDWPLGALLPIRVELSDFAVWIAQQALEQAAELLLWDYLAARYASLPALVGLLRERAQAGQALLLLDGLDEVGANAEGQPLKRVRQAIEALAADPGLRHILVTCRVLDYEEPRRQLPGWPAERLIPFSSELQREFIDRWYGTLKRLQRPLIGDPDDLRRLLREAIGKRPDLRRLAGNPLLLTMMALLHASKGRLPEKRAELYAECLDLLLRRWRRGPGRPSLEEQLGIPGWDTSDTDRLLNHLGYVAHSQERGENGAEDAIGGTTLPHELLITTATHVFKLYRDAEPFARAERFCAYVGRYSNGLLQQHGPESYRFPHRTFQEFLAARRLVDDRDWPEDERDVVTRLLARAGSPQWREVLLLAVSLLILHGQVRSIANLVQELLPDHARKSRGWAEQAVIAGEILTQAERKHFDGVGKAQLWDTVVDALRYVMQPNAEPSSMVRLVRKVVPLASVNARVRAGAALSVLGDPRLGIGLLEPQWCVVPAGPFLLGSNDTSLEARYDGKPQCEVELPAFRISRYPITNAQWQYFMSASGYSDQRWWSTAGWQAKEQANWVQPREWDNPQFNGSNQPVVGVSRYEATAFCHWLSAELGYEVRLPSEAEWEKAARGTDGRIYPWGNDWDAARANTDESGIGTTTPVGCFPDGASPYGVLDLSGNVWEWTATPWTGNYQHSDGTARETEDGERFVLRGGAWAGSQRIARCACRTRDPPSNRGSTLGVRVVAALTLEK